MAYPVGSFFLTTVPGWGGYLISLGQALAGDPSRWDHAGIVVDSDGTVVEAEPGGARIGHLSAYAGQPLLVCDGPVQRELALFDAGQIRWDRSRDDLEQFLRDDVVTEARKLIGTPYSIADYVALGLLHLHLPSTWVRQRVETSGHLICSALVDRAMCRAGIHLFDDGRLSGDVMPADLAAWAEDYEAKS
jgi:cell wall-associated NlpC family hydrolase